MSDTRESELDLQAFADISGQLPVAEKIGYARYALHTFEEYFHVKYSREKHSDKERFSRKCLEAFQKAGLTVINESTVKRTRIPKSASTVPPSAGWIPGTRVMWGEKYNARLFKVDNAKMEDLASVRVNLTDSLHVSLIEGEKDFRKLSEDELKDLRYIAKQLPRYEGRLMS